LYVDPGVRKVFSQHAFAAAQRKRLASFCVLVKARIGARMRQSE
jgi:hypothetical protein